MQRVSPKKLAEILGVNVESVWKYLQEGRLSNSARKNGRTYSIDVDAARVELFGHEAERPRAVTVPRQPSGSGDTFGERYEGQSLDECQAVEKFYKAKLAEVQYRRALGDLVDASDLEAAYANEITSCRSKILAIPSRIVQRVPLDEETVALITSLIREALEELGKAADEVRSGEEQGEE